MGPQKSLVSPKIYPQLYDLSRPVPENSVDARALLQSEATPLEVGLPGSHGVRGPSYANVTRFPRNRQQANKIVFSNRVEYGYFWSEIMRRPRPIGISLACGIDQLD